MKLKSKILGLLLTLGVLLSSAAVYATIPPVCIGSACG